MGLKKAVLIAQRERGKGANSSLAAHFAPCSALFCFPSDSYHGVLSFSDIYIKILNWLNVFNWVFHQYASHFPCLRLQTKPPHALKTEYLQQHTHSQFINNHSHTLSYCVYIQTAKVFCSDIRNKFLNINLPWITMRDFAKACWKMATHPSDEFAFSNHSGGEKKRSKRKEPSLNVYKAASPPTDQESAGWKPAGEQWSECYSLWSRSRLYLFTLKWIFSVTGLQTPWYPISRCVKQKTWSQYKQRANPLIKSSTATAPGGGFDLFY